MRGARKLLLGVPESGALPSEAHESSVEFGISRTEESQRAAGPALFEPESKTWTAPPPSASYSLVDTVEKQFETKRGISAELMEDMKGWKEQLIQIQKDKEEEARRSQIPCAGPAPPPDSAYHVVVSETGEGHQKPQMGDTVRMGYIVVLEDDPSPIDMCPDFEYVLGTACRGDGQVVPHALDVALKQLLHGQIASITSKLSDLFPSCSPVLRRAPAEALAVCEVKLMEIYSTKDCSFQKGQKLIIKEAIKEGVGAWCDNPTDEGYALLRIEEVTTVDGVRLFPLSTQGPCQLQVTPGNGEVCDAIECAMLEMRAHETAVITCLEPTMCTGCNTLGIKPEKFKHGAIFKVTLMDYGKGPDLSDYDFDEAKKLEFAERRKAVANHLLFAGRFHLAIERYRRILDLFHHIDAHKMRDRFLGKPELLRACKDMRRACRLNLALCYLKVSDPVAAKKVCDAVLRTEPENIKALYRRAQAHCQHKDYLQACRDLERLLDIDGNVVEAAQLLQKLQRKCSSVDRQQSNEISFTRMLSGLDDHRSIKYDPTTVEMDWSKRAPELLYEP